MPNKMPDRIVGARLWRAIFARWTVLSCHGLPPFLEELKQARTVFTHPVPSGRIRTQCLPTAVKHSCQDVFVFFLMDNFPFLAVKLFRILCSILQVNHPRLATLR
jgi:hypothetical protein